MESQKFQFHESGETFDKGWHGRDFEIDFGKFLLFRLICHRENFRNFRFTREKKGTGKFDDFTFAYDDNDGKTKYSLIQLKHLSDETKKISVEDLKVNSKSYFGLPYYFDYYIKSLSCLSSDKDLKEAELESLIFCTNVGFEDSLECISKREIVNEGLFQNSGKLYKLFINFKERQEIFHEQFLSERKRLANEMTNYVMQNKVIHLGSMINDDSFSLIQKFSEMLLNHVVDVERNKFKNSFLDPQLKNINKELDCFRIEFFDSLYEFQEKFPHLRKIKTTEGISLSSTDERDTEEVIEFLREKTINISTVTEQKTLKKLSEELVLSVMLQKPFDIKSRIHDQNNLRKLIKLIKEEVIDLDSKTLRETFLTENFKSKTELKNFRHLFFKEIRIFCENLKDKNGNEIEELLKFFNSPLKVQTFESSLKFILEKEKREVIDILKNREIRFTAALDVETFTEIYPSGEVDITEIDKNILAFLNLLTFAVNQSNFEDFISDEMSKLINKKEDQKFLYSGFKNFMKNWHNKGLLSVLVESKLKYREWITEEKLLNNIKNLKILFQNREVKISDISSGCEMIKPELFIYNFTTSAIMRLGESIDKDYGSFYIQRSLVQRKRINANSLINALTEQQSQDIVIFTIPRRFNCKNFDKLLSLSVKLQFLPTFNDNHYYYFTNTEFTSKFFGDFFINNREVISKRTVHWITFLGKDFRYESTITASNTKSVEIREFFSNKSFTSSEFDENENILIITGDPGSGKSVLLKHLSIRIKNQNVDRFWVILIPLNKYQKILDKYDKFIDIKNVIDFLAEIENCDNDFSRNALSYFLYNNRLILLFDGFDEIHESRKQEKILQLLKFLKSENLTKQIWITSRPHCVHQIEDDLEYVAFNIKDINEAEQIKLVTDEWMIYHGNSQGNLIEKNATNFVKHFNCTITRNDRDLLGVPLMTFMFSHAYIKEAVSSSPVFPQNVSLVRLFENFILSKFNVFFCEKIKIENILENDCKISYEKKYQIFALRNSDIISREHANVLSESVNTELPDVNVEMLKRIGLIYESSGVCTFIHETFAEYYIADLLISVADKCMNEHVLQSVRSILWKPENRFIFYVFDTHTIEKSQENKILESIMSGDDESVTSLGKESLSTIDILGRNCFYYAIKYNRFSILYDLINKDIKLVFEPFFIDSLKGFDKEYSLRKIDDEVYLKLFEYILEKENEKGYFVLNYLDQFLRLDTEMNLKHWEIATKLIVKFGRKLNNPSSYLHVVLNAPEEFFDVFMKLVYEDENPRWDRMLNTLICFPTERLKRIIATHKKLISKMPVCSSLLDQKNSLKLLFGNTSNDKYFLKLAIAGLFEEKNFFKLLLRNEETSSDFVNSVKMRSENFSLLFKFLFESRDVSLETFHKKFFSDNGVTRMSKLLPVFSDISLDSLKYRTDYSYISKQNSPPWHVLYRTGLSDEVLTIVLNLLSKGHEEHVKRIYNVCLSYKDREKASRYWEEAKRTELRKYYAIGTNNCDEISYNIAVARK